MGDHDAVEMEIYHRNKETKRPRRYERNTVTDKIEMKSPQLTLNRLAGVQADYRSVDLHSPKSTPITIAE